jgi:hypothetical protein
MPVRRAIRGVAVIAVVLADASVVLACPVCDSPAGAQVRAGIVGDGLAAGLLATLLPFALTAAVIAVVHFGGHTRGRPGDGEQRP